MTEILKSAMNPEGAKLEELLVAISKDLAFRNDQFEHNKNDANKQVYLNNAAIINILDSALTMQNQTIRIISEGEFEPDEGSLLSSSPEY